MRNQILHALLIASILASPAAMPCKAFGEVDRAAVENYKKLKSKDILLRVEKGRVFVMVANNRWETAKTNLKIIAGDKLKIEPGTIATLDFYGEFDIHIPESEMTTVDPAGVTQLINGALFRTVYRDGTYVSEVVREPSKMAQYKFRGALKDRDKQLEYAKNKLYKREMNFENEVAVKQGEEANYLRARISQAKNFGNGFVMNYKDSEYKQSIDHDIAWIERERRRLEVDVLEKMAASEALKKAIATNLANSGGTLDVSADKKKLDDMNSSIRAYTQKLDYSSEHLRELYEMQNKINLKPKNREW